MARKYGFHLVIIGFLALFFSCTTTKKLPPAKDTQIVKAEDNKPKKEVDTAKWKDSTNTNNPDLPDVPANKGNEGNNTKKDETGTNKKIYTIAMVIPFSSSESDARFLQYYAGAKIAAEELEKEGISLEINVFDANDKVAISTIDVGNTQLIFAPNDESQLKSLIEIGKAHQIPVVSPFFSLSSVENNPYYIQLKPSLKSHFAAIVNHIASKFNSKDVVLVARDTKTDRSWLKYFQTSAKLSFHLTEEKTFTELFIKEDSLNQGVNVFGPMLAKGKKVFVFPNYSYKDELYLYNAMRRLQAEKAGHEVNVYGMSILKDSDKMTFDYFEQLNIRIPTSKHVDGDKEELKAFDVKFYDKFGALPDNDSYEGSDNMLFIGRSISKYGTDFQYKLKEDNNYYLQTAFDIKACRNEDSIHEVDYFENKHLDILEFNGLKFIRTK